MTFLICAMLAFPQTPPTVTSASLPEAKYRTLYDLDGDGLLEILQVDQVGPVGTVTVFGVRGGEVVTRDGWPKEIEGTITFLPPTVADVDPCREGPEIVVANSNGTLGAYVRVYSIDGGLINRIVLGDVGYLRAAVVGDLDGDGLREIVVCSKKMQTTVIHALHSNGHTLGHEWPVIAEPTNSLGVATMFLSLSDIDRDGTQEVVYAASLNPLGPGQPVPSRLHVFNWRGERMPGWEEGQLLPEDEGGFNQPAIADLDNDGSAEIIAVSTKQSHCFLHVYSHKGGEEYPRTYCGAIVGAPIVGDIDGDGYKEILVADKTYRETRVFDHNGKHIDTFDAAGQLALANLDGLGGADLIGVHESADDSVHFVALDMNGASLLGWPLAITGLLSADRPNRLVASVGYMDERPGLDIAAGEVFVSGMSSYVDDNPAWPMFLRDPSHSSAVPPTESKRLIVSSVPLNGAVDARMLRTRNGTLGWDKFILRFSEPVNMIADDIVLAEVGGDGSPPDISDIVIKSETVEIVLASHIEVGAWTSLTYLPSGQRLQWGYLPGDVDGDNTVSALDIMALIDGLNGVRVLAEHHSDMDRDGVFDHNDLLVLIDSLQRGDSVALRAHLPCDR